MITSLVSKLTNGMLWWLVVPTAFLLISLTVLVGAYARVAWNANEVSYEGPFGKLTAKIENIQTRIQNAYSVLDQQQSQLNLASSQLEKLLNEMRTPTATELQNSSISFNAEEVSKIIKNINNQSETLIEQKKNLMDINSDLQQFKLKLQDYTKIH